MQIWNRFIQNEEELRLEIISKPFLTLLRVLGIGCMILGIGGVLYGQFTAQDAAWLSWLGGVLPLWLARIIGGILLLITGQCVFWVYSFMNGAAMQFRFHLTTQRLQIENTPRAYAFLPTNIPFSEIRQFQILVPPSGQRSEAWQLELLLEDGKFCPLTAFKNEAKGRHIARTLQMALGKPLQDLPATTESFQEKKRRFLTQFQPEAGQA